MDTVYKRFAITGPLRMRSALENPRKFSPSKVPVYFRLENVVFQPVHVNADFERCT